MSQLTSFCTAPDRCTPRSATLVWGVTRAAREALHELHRSGPCRVTAPFGEKDPTARRPRELCESVGCVDLFMDVWVPAHAAMHARMPALPDAAADPAFAYLTSSARSRVAELNRQARVARGGVARPQRRDGTVGRIAASFEDPWPADVFRFLLGYAAAPGGRGGVWPLDVLTHRKNMWDGGNRTVGSRAARDELRADVESCLSVVRRVAGAGWLHDCILVPLANRAGAPLPADDGDARALWAGEPDDGLAAAAGAMLGDMLGRIAGGTGPGAALRAAVETGLGDGPPPPAWAAVRDDEIAVRRLAKRLVSELVRMEEAA